MIRSRVLRTWGHSESGLAEMLGPRIEELDLLGNPTLAFLASGIEGIKVRITAKAADDAAAEAILAAEEAALRTLLGDYVFGTDDADRWNRSCSTCCAPAGSPSRSPNRSPAGWSARA